MASPRSLAAALSTLLLVLTAACTSADDSPGSGSESSQSESSSSESGSEPSGGPQEATLQILPQLAQPGADPADPAAAESSLAARFSPASEGREVVLQVRAGDTWDDVATATQDSQGMVEFNAPYEVEGRAASYRAVATEDEELEEKATAAVSTDKWGAPALDDTFDDTALPAHWKIREQEPVGDRLCTTSSEDAIRVADGALRLSVLLDEDRQGEARCPAPDGRVDWRKVGHVATQGTRDFRYGFAAARIKFQPLPGQHGAFWLQPSQAQAETGDASQTGAEIDVVEWFGERANPNSELTNFVRHYPEKVQKNAPGREAQVSCGLVRRPARFGEDWAGSYHVFSVEWTPERYIFRIDGKETCRTTEGVSGIDQFLILSLQANTYEIPLLDGDPAPPHRSQGLPQHMYVDWVRYWPR